MKEIDWNTLDVTRSDTELALIFSKDRIIDKTTVVKLEKSQIWRLIWLLIKGRIGMVLGQIREKFLPYYDTKD